MTKKTVNSLSVLPKKTRSERKEDHLFVEFLFESKPAGPVIKKLIKRKGDPMGPPFFNQCFSTCSSGISELNKKIRIAKTNVKRRLRLKLNAAPAIAPTTYTSIADKRNAHTSVMMKRIGSITPFL